MITFKNGIRWAFIELLNLLPITCWYRLVIWHEKIEDVISYGKPKLKDVFNKDYECNYCGKQCYVYDYIMIIVNNNNNKHRSKK